MFLAVYSQLSLSDLHFAFGPGKCRGIEPRASHWQASVLLLHAWPWFTLSGEQLRNHQVIIFKVRELLFLQIFLSWT